MTTMNKKVGDIYGLDYKYLCIRRAINCCYINIIVMFVIASRRINELYDETMDQFREIKQLKNEKNKIIDKANAEIDKANKLIDKANAEIDKANKLIEEKNISINSWMKYADNLRAKRDSTKNELDEANKTIKELNIKLERTNEIIDRLSNSNMNAPQPIMEPQVIQRIA